MLIVLEEVALSLEEISDFLRVPMEEVSNGVGLL